MAVIVRLEHEMPPHVIPPYAMDGETTVGEIMEAACKYFKREIDESKLFNFQTDEELTETEKKLKDYGLGHWSLLELRSSTQKTYKRVTFG
jgi:hypothetical protein